jgi:hypothetical protein
MSLRPRKTSEPRVVLGKDYFCFFRFLYSIATKMHSVATENTTPANKPSKSARLT